jgi:hypothetical protein
MVEVRQKSGERLISLEMARTKTELGVHFFV